ncbi:unnamed protein product [Calypogeia fissa]
MDRLMLVDEQGFPQLMQTLREGFRLESKNYLFKHNEKGKNRPPLPQGLPSSSSSEAFGINLVVGDPYDELGWMAYENGELVGFAYDGEHCDLYGKHFRCGHTEVEVPREPTSEFDESDDGWDDLPESLSNNQQL